MHPKLICQRCWLRTYECWRYARYAVSFVIEGRRSATKLVVIISKDMVAMDAGPDRPTTDLDPELRTSVYRPVSHARSGLPCISDRLQPTSVGGFRSTGKGGVGCMIDGAGCMA
jgi:hypothetical protein